MAADKEEVHVVVVALVALVAVVEVEQVTGVITIVIVHILLSLLILPLKQGSILMQNGPPSIQCKRDKFKN